MTANPALLRHIGSTALDFATLGTRNLFRPKRSLDGTSNIASRLQGRSLWLNQCGDPSLRVDRSAGFAVTLPGCEG